MKTNRSSLGLLQVQQATGKKIPQETGGFNQALAQHMDAKKQTQTSETTEQKRPIDGKQSGNSKEGEEEAYPAYAFTSPFFLYRNENPPAAGLALQTAESGNADIQTWQASMCQKQAALGRVYLPEAMDNFPGTALTLSNAQPEAEPQAEAGRVGGPTAVSMAVSIVDAGTIPSPCAESEETQAKAAATAGSDPSPIETETMQTVEEACGRTLPQDDQTSARTGPATRGDKTAAPPAWQSNGLEQQLMMPQAIRGSQAIPGETKTANQTEIVQSIREGMRVQMTQIQHGETAVVKVRLSPEHLGEIEIQITMVDDEVDATFVVHSTETKELINNQVLQITESLRQQQVTLANVHVSLATDNQMGFSFFDGFGQSKKEAPPQPLKRQAGKRDALTEAEVDNAVSANGISILA